MKCVGIFSFQPNTVFLWTDSEFEIHLQQLSEKSGLIPDENNKDDSINLDAVLHFFSPMVTSFQFMTDIGNPYSSITTEDGKIIVMKQFGDLVYIAICGDKEESEWYLTRKVHVLHQLVNMLYGPSINLLRPSVKAAKLKAWNKVGKLLETWQLLSGQEHIFLVEAFERLLVNRELNNTTLSLLEDVLAKANRDGHTLHSLLLVNNKLLGLYSTKCAPELQVTDVLLLIVLIKHTFQYDDPTTISSVHRTPSAFVPTCMGSLSDETLFAKSRCSSNPVSINISKKGKHSDNDESPRSDVYHSANSSLHKEDNIGLPILEDGFHTPMEESPLLSYKEESTFLADVSEGESSSSSDRGKEVDKKADSSTEKETETEMPEYFYINVFLKTVDSPFTPHLAHCMLINKACILIIISETRCISYSTHIYHSLSTFNYVLNGSHRRMAQESFNGTRLYEKLDTAMKKLIDGIPVQSEFQSAKIKSTISFIGDWWERAKQSKMKQFLENEKRPEVPIGLTSILLKITEALKVLFSQLYANQRPFRTSRPERFLKVINSIQTVSRNRLKHFGEYLQVRGQCNVTMTAYINDFPGLVHFVYINRSANLLIAPTLNVNRAELNGSQKLPINVIIKQRLWDVWQYVEIQVVKGYSSFIFKDGDFTYSYYLWFEDNMGKPLPIQKLPKPIHQTVSTGILSGNFYRNLIRHCFDSSQANFVHCYELLCIHVGIVSKRYAAASAQKLSRWLWETSGEALSPVGLL